MHTLPRFLALAALVVVAALSSLPAFGQALPCKPCAGLRLEEPGPTLEALEHLGGVGEGQVLFVAWSLRLDGSAPAIPTAALEASGVTPWISLIFQAPAPILDHLDALQRELEEAARLAADAPEGSTFQIVWQPSSEAGETAGLAEEARQEAFLLKRAAVAVAGARSGARIASRPLPPTATWLEAFYAEDVAAYLDALALGAGADEATAVEALSALDPGKPVVVDARPLPEVPEEALAMAAADAVGGASATLFAASEPGEGALVALRALARELAGDLSYDPYSSPASSPAGGQAWSFVRGEDLALRIIARVPEEQRANGELVLELPDSALKSPGRVQLEDGEVIPLAGVRRRESGLEVRVSDPGPIELLSFERMTAAELEGIEGLEEELTVASERQMPVEEILRRLQAFEDAQTRKLDHYQALNTTHIRFQGSGVGSIETTFKGAFFYLQGQGFDWAWQELYINGVRWRRKTIPRIPLVQPEKAAVLPLEITFSKEYAYRLRGTARVEGRDCWVVDFEPATVGDGRSLYQGTVWVDREIYARVKTRAVQLGLQGDVLSNEETFYYSPIDAAGEAAPWALESYFLPLRVTGQQIWSLLNGSVVAEREVLLSGLHLNGPDFTEQRQAVLDSDSTMVRDTDQGLQYLVKDKETGERTVTQGFKQSGLFFGGGVFVDDSLDFPLPLGGADYYSFDFRGTGAQVNAFFAGALLTASIADPELFGSRFDAGADLFALGVKTTDTLFRDNREVEAEDVQELRGSLSLSLGHPVGQFGKVNLVYGLRYSDFSRGDDTAEEFVLPQDHLTHSFGLNGRYSRSGYRLSLGGSFNHRTDWEPWGLPGSDDFDPDAEDYLLWEASAAKSWYLPHFRKVGLELQYVDGQDLDRFSKYQFGFFSDVRVHGYQSDRVRAEEALALHGTYGFELSEMLRIDAVADLAWATDEASGLDRELLAGVGVAGTFVGPWGTLVNLDLGVPVAGPDDGFSLFLVFLKLFE